MEIDYQRKYIQLKKKCKKQEDTIGKLQTEIKERCQSDLLYSSTNKKPSAQRNEISPVKQKQSSKLEHTNSLQESNVEKFIGSEINEDSFMKSSMSNDEDLLRSRIISLTISSQISIVEAPNPNIKSKYIEAQEAKDKIIQQFKERISKIHQEKNTYVRDAQRQKGQLTQALTKMVQLERKLDLTSKSEKKMKNKLGRMPQIQKKIHQIYQLFLGKINKNENVVYNSEIEDDTDEKIEFIRKIISQQKFGVDKMQKLQENEQVSDANSTQGFQISVQKKLQENFNKQNYQQQASRRIQQQKSIYDKEITRLRESHLMQIEEMRKNYEKEIRQLKESHLEQTKSMKQSYQNECKNLKLSHQQYVRQSEQIKENIQNVNRKLKEYHQKQIEQIKNLHQNQTKKLNQQYLKEIEEIRKDLQMENSKLSSSQVQYIEQIKKGVSNESKQLDESSSLRYFESIQKNLQNQNRQLKQIYQIQIEKIKGNIQNEIGYLKQKHLKQIEQMRERFQNETKQLEESNEQQMKQIREKFQIQNKKLKQSHKLQIYQMRINFQNQNRKLKQQHQRELQSHLSLQQHFFNLQKETLSNEACIAQMDEQLQLTKEQLKRSQVQLKQNGSQIQKYREQLEQSKILHSEYEKTKQQLSKSRSIINDLQHSRMNKEVSDLKEYIALSDQKNKKEELISSPVKINQKLEEPYYIEEELSHDPNNQYVKRSFIRKKIVRRNFSATAYRVVSKSKEEVDSIINKKMSEYSGKSLQKKEKLKQSKKLEKEIMSIMESNLPNPRISEVSEENRQSDYITKQADEMVKIVEVTTNTPKEMIKTTKVYSKNGEDTLMVRKKEKY